MVSNVAEELRMPLKSLINIRIAEWEVRNGKKFVRKDAAKTLDMAPQHFSALVAGRVHTTAEKLFQLAEMLECKVDELYKYTKEE